MDAQKKEEVRSLIASVAGVSENEVDLETKLVSDLGFDSWDFVEIEVELEEVFPGVTIPEEGGIQDLTTVGDLINYIEKLPQEPHF